MHGEMSQILFANSLPCYTGADCIPEVSQMAHFPSDSSEPPARGRKSVACRQDAIDALPYGSGEWTVEGVPGLLVRCGARTKVFRLQRRIHGRLVRRTLGEMTAAQARRRAMEEWARLRPSPAQGKMTLAEAWDRYLSERRLAEATLRTFRRCIRNYLRDWAGRSLESIGADRMGFRARMLELAWRHGTTTAVNCLKMFRAVYNYHRKVNLELPECPSVVVDLPTPRPRDWALTDEDLRRWWEVVKKRPPLRRTWWLVLLLTGARARSMCRLEWRDIDFEAGLIHFRVVKGERPYTVPMADRLRQVLEEYRELRLGRGDWVFPSPVRPGAALYEGRDSYETVAGASPHRLRHTMRTRLAECGATPDLARVALGHSLTRDISSGYITAKLLIEAVRPLMNAVAERYTQLLGW